MERVLIMIFSIALPIIAWLMFLGFLRNRGLGWRTAFLAASVAWGIGVTFLTETLSLFAAFNRPCLATGWAVLAISAGSLLFRSGALPAIQPLPTLARMDKVIVGIIGGVLACTLVIAIVAPPNNWDSLTYHMTRVMFWIQQGGVAHFPTNNLRQIELNPWAEFAIAHLQLLSGGDRLANLVQWFSMAGCIVGVSLISGLLGARMRGQLLSGLVTATIPMAVLQSSSTQNDLAVSFWLVCFIAFGIMSAQENSRSWAVLMSCSLGLAILTKGTAYIYAFPFMIWFFIRDMKLSWRSAVPKYLVLAGIVLLVNLGHYQRNYSLFHHPLQSGKDSYGNGRLTPAVVLSNLSRNAALHLLTPWNGTNSQLIKAIDSFHNILGIAADDPDTTWPGMTPGALNFALHEDLSGNFLHLCLFMAVLAIIIVNRRYRSMLPYALSIMAGVLLFCILLRWQPWASRLQLPLFVIFSVLTGCVLSDSRKAWVSGGMVAVLSLAVLPYTFCNQTRPLVTLQQFPLSIFTIPRWALYFTNEGNRGIATLSALEGIQKGGFKKIALDSGADSWEYPLWILTRENELDGPRIEHINVKNTSNTIPQPAFRADVVVVIADDGTITLKEPGINK